MKKLGQSDILLVNTPHFNMLYPPAGIAYICESVRNANLIPEILDLNIWLINKYRNNGIEPFWSGGEDGKQMLYFWKGEGFAEVFKIFENDFIAAADAIAKNSAQVVGFSVSMANIKASDKLASMVRKRSPEKIIIYGGFSCHYASMCRVLSDEPDYICVGEGEVTVVEFIKTVLGDGDPGEIPGIMEIRSGKGRYEPPIGETELDKINWPTWRDFNLTEYRTIEPFIVLSVNGSRGCNWGQCEFCSDKAANPGFRRRSTESILAEISYNRKINNVRDFHFSDLILNGDHAGLERLCDRIIEADIDIAIAGQFHVDKRLTTKLFKKIKGAGMPIANFGLETGSAKVMKLMRKGYNPRLAQTAIRNAKQAGLKTSVNLLLGFPGETEREIEETVDFLTENKGIIDILEVVNVCSVQYGSNLWLNPEKFGISFHLNPRDFEARDWNTIDGQNTSTSRKRALKYVSRKVSELGFKRGYNSMEFNFLSTGHDEFAPALFQYLLRENINENKVLDECKNALVIRSCDMLQANSLIKALECNYPDIVLETLCQQTAISSLKAFVDYPHRITLCPDGALSPENLPKETAEQLRLNQYDLVLVPFGLMPPETYDDVLRLAFSINAKKVIVVSRSGKVDLVSN